MIKKERYLLFGVVAGVAIASFVTASLIGNTIPRKIAAANTIELTCDISISENSAVTAYTLTVAGYLANEPYDGNRPQVILQSFEIITAGAIEKIDNIVLCMQTEGGVQVVKYDCTFAFWERIYDSQDKMQSRQHNASLICYNIV